MIGALVVALGRSFVVVPAGRSARAVMPVGRALRRAVRGRRRLPVTVAVRSSPQAAAIVTHLTLRVGAGA